MKIVIIWQFFDMSLFKYIIEAIKKNDISNNTLKLSKQYGYYIHPAINSSQSNLANGKNLSWYQYITRL